MSEFDLIKRYFSELGDSEFVRLSVGDDAAITTIPDGYELVTTVDTLVSDVHFFSDTAPCLIGHKALAVNLSDLAAMAATPAWFTLSLALPNIDEQWLSEFSRGMSDLALAHGIALIGGDTVCGPLTITIQACGLVEYGKAVRRDGAKVGDGLFVTGPLGDARLALELINGDRKTNQANYAAVCDKLHRPKARVNEGLCLKEMASAAVDISDGLVADLSHILERSNVGAEIMLDGIPRSDALRESVDANDALILSLYGGDDYELCFTVPEDKQEMMLSQMQSNGFSVYRIGTITQEKMLYAIDSNGTRSTLERRGYDHFGDKD